MIKGKPNKNQEKRKGEKRCALQGVSLISLVDNGGRQEFRSESINPLNPVGVLQQFND